MKPGVSQILGLSANKLLGEIAPQLPTSFAQGGVSLTAFLLMFSAQEAERGADIRARENAAMRAVFAELSPLVSDAALKSKLEAAARTADTSLKISDLDAANYELRRLLIALQIHVEDLPGGKARDAEKRIWKVLQDAAAARVVAIG
jgi:hypothetical protein